MNAAAKMIHQGNIFNGQFADIQISKSLCIQVALLVAVLLSALAVIFATNGYRITFNELQNAENQAHKLELHWGQLMLEQASLEAPLRVQTLAADKLKMYIPGRKQAKLLVVQ